MITAQIAIRGTLGCSTSLLQLRPSLSFAKAVWPAVCPIANVSLRRGANQLLTSQPVSLLWVLWQVYPERCCVCFWAWSCVSQHKQAHLLIDRVVVVHGCCGRLRFCSNGRWVHVLYVVRVERLLTVEVRARSLLCPSRDDASFPPKQTYVEGGRKTAEHGRAGGSCAPSIG
jgi:hypothetical protein